MNYKGYVIVRSGSHWNIWLNNEKVYSAATLEKAKQQVRDWTTR